jgi:hypothetical protein
MKPMKFLLTVVAAAGLAVATLGAAASAQGDPSHGLPATTPPLSSGSETAGPLPCIVPTPNQPRPCAVPVTPAPRPCVAPTPGKPAWCGAPITPAKRPCLVPAPISTRACVPTPSTVR